MKVDYPHRLLLDYEFVEELASGTIFRPNAKFDLLKWLMYIKATSASNKGDHNIILDDEFTKLNENKIIGEAEIKRIAKPIPMPEEFDDIQSPLGRNLVTAIITTNSPPWSCYILTSKKREKEYKVVKNFVGLRDVTVVSGSEAYNTVKIMFSLFEAERHG